MASAEHQGGIDEEHGASGPRTTLLLFNDSHIDLVLSGGMTLQEIIERARRHLSQTGEAYLEASAIMP